MIVFCYNLPNYDETYLFYVEIAVQVNGKLRGKLTIAKDANEEEIRKRNT